MERQQIFRLLLTSEHETSYILYLLKQQKILYNIDRVAAAEKDIELFKKLESSDIW